LGLNYRIEYSQSVVDQDIPNLTKSIRDQIKKAIENRLISHPIEFGKPLRYSLKGARSLRVNDWRVIYKIEPPDLVLIVKIGHRKEVYES
jgi:addiction module RelE/StbE family toxin